MPMTPKEKQQAIVLGVLVLALAAVVLVIDPFGFRQGPSNPRPQPAPAAEQPAAPAGDQATATSAEAPASEEASDSQPTPAAPRSSGRGSDGLPLAIQVDALDRGSPDPLRTTGLWPPPGIGTAQDRGRQWFPPITFDAPGGAPRARLTYSSTVGTISRHVGGRLTDIIENKEWEIKEIDFRRGVMRAEQTSFPYREGWFNERGQMIEAPNGGR